MVSGVCACVWCRHKDRAPAGPFIQRNPWGDSEALSPGLSAGPPASGAVPRPQPTEMTPKRNPLTMERLEGHLKTTKLGYARMNLPDEAEPGDEDTAAIIRRVKEQQKKEEAVQQKEQRILKRFLKRDWGHSGFEALQSRRLSREQLQDKVWGALNAFAERRDSDELRHKVEVSLIMLQGASMSIDMVCLLASTSAGCVLDPSLAHSVVHPFIDFSFIHSFTHSFIHSSIHQRQSLLGRQVGPTNLKLQLVV